MKKGKGEMKMRAGTAASYVGVIYEEFQHRIDLVIEKMDALDQEVQGLQCRLQQLENTTDQGFAFVRATFKNFERLFADFRTDIEALKKKVG